MPDPPPTTAGSAPRARPGVLAAVCLGWGTIPLVAERIHLAAPAIVFGRVWIAAAGLVVVVAVTRPAGPRLLRTQPLRALAVGALLAVHWTCMFAAYDRAPDSTVIFLIFLAPVGIALVERPAPRLLGALALAVGGFGLVAAPTLDARGGATAGIGLAAVSSVTFVALVLLAKPLAAVYGGLRLTLLEMVIAGIVLIPSAVSTDWSGLRRSLPWLVLLGLVHTAIGTVVYLRTLAVVPATQIGILGYLEPVGVVVFGWALVGNTPTVATVGGGVLVVIAGAVAVATPTTPSEVPARVSR